MYILAIVGSPKINGNTNQLVKQIGQQLVDTDASIEFEILQLGNAHLNPCRGCFVCLSRGEHLCPLKDDRAAIEAKLTRADGVIFASPVYTYNVSWAMKNFLDRFAYRCHRPAFSGKKTMVVVTTGAVGIGFVSRVLSFMAGTMGFATCARAGVTFPPEHELNPVRLKKEMDQLKRAIDRFYRHLSSKKPIQPTVLKLLTFRFQKRAFAQAPRHLADFQYWHDQSWLDPSTYYYYPVQVGVVKRTIIDLVSRLVPVSVKSHRDADQI